jgi:pantetheine-phosphate adenylyltransferase
VTTAVCPGSFDPVTNGHLDIVARAASLFDEVTVAVLVNPAKSGLFTLEERLEMLRDGVSGLPNVTVASFEGLLVDFCAERGISAIVRGMRGFGDVDHELQMAQMNRRLGGVETVFLPASPEYSFLASSLLKEVAAYGGDVAGLVPDDVLAKVKQRLAERSAGR